MAGHRQVKHVQVRRCSTDCSASLLWCIKAKAQRMNKPRSPPEKWNVPAWIRQSWTRQWKYQCIGFVVYIQCIWGSMAPVWPPTRGGCEHGLCSNTELPCGGTKRSKKFRKLQDRAVILHYDSTHSSDYLGWIRTQATIILCYEESTNKNQKTQTQSEEVLLTALSHVHPTQICIYP